MRTISYIHSCSFKGARLYLLVSVQYGVRDLSREIPINTPALLLHERPQATRFSLDFRDDTLNEKAERWHPNSELRWRSLEAVLSAVTVNDRPFKSSVSRFIAPRFWFYVMRQFFSLPLSRWRYRNWLFAVNFLFCSGKYVCNRCGIELSVVSGITYIPCAWVRTRSLA